VPDPVLTVANKDACLTGLTTALGAMSKMILFTNNISVSEDTALADLTQPLSAGLATAKTVAAWSTPYEDPAGRFVVTGGSLTWIATGITTPAETIYGWAILDMAGMVVQMTALLDKPVPITEVGDGLTVTPTVPYGA